jgi:Uma2 family endonuclease
MSWDHGRAITQLISLLDHQLDPEEFQVFTELRVRRSVTTVLVPDVMVVPTAYGTPFQGRPGTLAIFSEPLPLVVEVWSASTGDYDIETKIPVYRQRGDREIWRLHPYERTLTRWQRQPDGSYRETIHRGGIVALMALPGVTIDLDYLFAA